MENLEVLLIFEKNMKVISIKHKAPFKSKSDSELVNLYKETNQMEIIGEFYERYNHIVYGICLKYLKNGDLSKDMSLEIFSTLYESLKKYEINDFKNWLLTVTRNGCLKHLKTEAREISEINTLKNMSDYFMESTTENNHIHEKENQLNALEKAIEQLKPEQKQCVQLFYLQDKTYQDIVEITLYDIKKVKSYIQNGKRNIQLLMENMLKTL